MHLQLCTVTSQLPCLWNYCVVYKSLGFGYVKVKMRCHGSRNRLPTCSGTLLYRHHCEMQQKGDDCVSVKGQ